MVNSPVLLTISFYSKLESILDKTEQPTYNIRNNCYETERRLFVG